jgi:molybdopterin-guanine dinucleotide biosynthesis protein A
VSETLAAVLAGGAGRRLGGAKPRASLRGRPLISYPVAAALDAGLATVALAKRDTALPALPCPVLREPALPRHPLCGIVTALRHAGGRPVLVIGCDMPLLTPALLAWIAALERPAVACLDGALQPLLARYAPEQLPALEAALREQAPLRCAVESLGPRLLDESALARFGDPRALCLNVNDRADLARAEALLAARGG